MLVKYKPKPSHCFGVRQTFVYTDNQTHTKNLIERSSDDVVHDLIQRFVVSEDTQTRDYDEFESIVTVLENDADVKNWKKRTDYNKWENIPWGKPITPDTYNAINSLLLEQKEAIIGFVDDEQIYRRRCSRLSPKPAIFSIFAGWFTDAWALSNLAPNREYKVCVFKNHAAFAKWEAYYKKEQEETLASQDYSSAISV